MTLGFFGSFFLTAAVATTPNRDYSFSDTEKLMLLIIGLILLAFFLVVAWLIWRVFSKNQGLSGGTNADFSILDRLTEEEARMVRDALVRQTMQRENADRKAGATLAELERIAAGGAEAIPPPDGKPPRPLVVPTPAKPAETHSASPSETNGMPKVRLPETPPWESDDLSGEATLILDPNRSASGGRKREETPAPPAGGGIDLETLYRKGLIAREEYERLRALAERARNE